jgi:hypothetical protein
MSVVSDEVKRRKKSELIDKITSIIPADWKDDVNTAFLLVRQFRLDGSELGLNPKAMRLAIKFLSLIDTHFANTTQEEEKLLDDVARQLFEAERDFWAKTV